MILGFYIALGPLDAEFLEILAQPLQRPLVEKAGEVVRAVGQELAAAEPDEEIEVFALKPIGVGLARRLRQGGMCDAKRARVAAQTCQAVQKLGIRRT
jgi:hypothetical protein